MVSFFRKLEAQTGLLARMEGRRETNTPDMMATHPRTSDRIVQAIDLVKRAEATPGARLDRDAYLNRINGMLFGDDPRQGIVKGRTFIHPDLGFQFVVPPGFTLFNGDKQVIARGPNGAIIAFDLDQGARSRTPPASYLTDVWAQGKRLNSVENLQINGMQAATGTTQGSQRGTTFDLRLIAIRDDVGRMFRFMFVTPRSVTAALAQELQRTTFSFRSLSEAEARSARPLRLRVVPSGGQSIDSLAARMPFENYSRPWFEVLNGLEPGQTALRTSRVKVVAE
jgi:predicted Zn-dependent protease